MRRNQILRPASATLIMLSVIFLAMPNAQGQEPMALGQPCDTNVDSKPDPAATGRRVATPVDANLLKGNLPCAERVDIAGMFGDDVLRNLQRGFDFYSWLTFIALNAPSDNSGIANPQAQPNTKTKWEDTRYFIQLLDVMRPDDKDPQWNNADKREMIPRTCRAFYTPGTMVVEMIEESYNQPFKTGPLVDQHGRFAIFDILMNEPMFKFITERRLHRKSVQADFEGKIDFPSGTNDGLGPGAIMLKVSWKIMDEKDDKSRFHTVDALVAMPRAHGEQSDPPCLRKTLGLIGFHVVHKTINRRQWIWTSFEHVDNVPEQKDVDAGHLRGSYNFFDPTCDKTTCPLNETPRRPWAPRPELELKYHTAFQSQITRVVPLTDDTKDINGKFQNLLKNTVWKNYMLIGTQWPSEFACASKFPRQNPPPPPTLPDTDFEKEPDMNCAPAPTFLANTTLETFSQGEVPQASSSCMGCHGNAAIYQRPRTSTGRFFNQSDFTFIFEKARP